MDCLVCSNQTVVDCGKIAQYDGQLMYCNCCDTYFPSTFPTNEEILTLYQGYEFNSPSSGTRLSYLVFDFLGYIKARKIKKKLGKYTNQTSLLDFGGGTGFFTKALIRNGYDAELLEIDSGAVIMAESKGIPIAKSVQKKYDVVFTSHVIEHFKNLHTFFDEISQYIKSGGIVVVSCPNKNAHEPYRKNHIRGYIDIIENKTENIFWENPWFCFDPPRHFYAISDKTVVYLASVHGYEVLECFTEYANNGSFYFNPMYSLLNIFVLFKNPLNYFQRAYISCVSRINKRRKPMNGDSLTVILRKK